MRLERFEGCWTAIVTPMLPNGDVDYRGLEKNVAFQTSHGVNLVPTGTTGESPTLDWDEHERVIGETIRFAGGKVFVMAGTGSNSTREALRATEHAVEMGVDAVLLVDCYYNGPSSLELRKEYYAPIAERFPGIFVTPYIIPGRTGTYLEVEDLAILNRHYSNVRAVKEATGDMERMVKTRRLLGSDFDILSGDDDKTFEMMTNTDIGGTGVVSVVSNVVPGAVSDLTRSLLKGDKERAEQLRAGLDPLFKIVTVKTTEQYEGFTVSCRFRNPLPINTLMNGLGIPAGPCRRPLGKMTPKGVAVVREAVRAVYEKNPEFLAPIEEHYKVRVVDRIADDRFWKTDEPGDV
ncbi:MAG: 4-hydroxy-tetrahydrodipicolinate synthase [Deltaproteobacteria bacterium]|nr:4-hydroxy-tetrahydrodipicolinate synthase [Deltaproteobacteria bacterium]